MSSPPGHSPPAATRTVTNPGHQARCTSPAGYHHPPRSQPAPSDPGCPCKFPPVYRPRRSPSPSARNPPRNTRTRPATRHPTPGKAEPRSPGSARNPLSRPSRSRASSCPVPSASPRGQAGCYRTSSTCTCNPIQTPRKPAISPGIKRHEQNHRDYLQERKERVPFPPDPVHRNDTL